MNPILATLLVTALIAGTIVLGFYLGHVYAKRLGKTKPQALPGRLIRDYRVWAALAALLICGCVLGTLIHVLVAVVLLPMMCFALMMADSLEPVRKRCCSCGW